MIDSSGPLADERDPDDSRSTETGIWPQGWRISRRAHGPAEIAWLDLRNDAEQGTEKAVRLTWRIIDTFGNVSWPRGPDRSH
jgi:hypothetical protein